MTAGGRGGKPKAARGGENDGRLNAPRWPRTCTVARGALRRVTGGEGRGRVAAPVPQRNPGWAGSDLAKSTSEWAGGHRCSQARATPRGDSEWSLRRLFSLEQKTPTKSLAVPHPRGAAGRICQ